VAEKVSKQFQIAEQRGAIFAIVFGDEWPQVAVKDLRSGEQKLVSHEDLLRNPVILAGGRGSTSSSTVE